MQALSGRAAIANERWRLLRGALGSARYAIGPLAKPAHSSSRSTPRPLGAAARPPCRFLCFLDGFAGEYPGDRQPRAPASMPGPAPGPRPPCPGRGWLAGRPCPAGFLGRVLPLTPPGFAASGSRVRWAAGKCPRNAPLPGRLSLRFSSKSRSNDLCQLGGSLPVVVLLMLS